MKKKNKNKNTIIVLEGSYQDFDRIFTLFQSGELEELLGVSISDVDAFSKQRPTVSKLISNLSNWFQRKIIEGWEYETTLVGTLFAQENNPNFSFGSTRSARDIDRNLTTNENLDNSFEAALELGENNNNSPEVITELVNSLQNCENEEILWQLALSLGKLDPDNPQAAVAQRKEFEIGSLMLELLVAVKKREDEKLDILLQLYSTEEEYLPADLTVMILDEFGNINAQVKTQNKNSDSYINFSFFCSLGKQFTIQVALEDIQIEEYFQV